MMTHPYRRWLKGLVFAACFVPVLPLVALAWLEKRLTRGEQLFTGFSQLLALLPSRLGVGLRAAYYFGTLDECSWETNVGFGTIFSHRHARLGARASMGAYCVIGHADIGPGVRIGSRVSIPSGKRQHLDAAGRLSSSERFDTVAVGEGSWIGEGAILLAKVGYGCIVSAGAVVTTAVPDRSVVGGNPARVLRGPR
jgi:acetyltransferase-like isoleucine patch superfamily enzyme